LIFTRQMPMAQSKRDPYHAWIYKKIDLYITITERLRQDAIRYIPLPPSRIQRLYYGVSAPPARSERDPDFLSISQPGDFNIGVFSRLEFQKGQHLVIEAVRILRDRKIPARLYIAGDVMYEDYKASLVEQVQSSGLREHVVFKGFLSKPAPAMMCLDALVLPSRNEAFGLVLVEAMRSAVAVLGVNGGGVPEIIDDGVTGMLFEWDKPEQLADKLEQLFRDPALRRRLAEEGKQKADQQFDDKLHFDQLESLFRSVIAPR